MQLPFTVRVRRTRAGGRTFAGSISLTAGVAACLALTAAFWVPPVHADTSGTASYPVTQAFRAITVSTDGVLGSCTHPDGHAANGLAAPNGRCIGTATVSNTGDEARIDVGGGAWTTAGDGSVVPCDTTFVIFVNETHCSGGSLPTSSPFGLGLTLLPGNGQFAVRAVRRVLLLPTFVPTSTGETVRVPGLTSCDVAFAGTGPLIPGACAAADHGQQTTEDILLFGPSGGGAQLTSFSVNWQADPLP